MRIIPCALTLSLLLLASTAVAQWNPLNPVTSVEKQSDGVVFRMEVGLLRLQICSDSIVRVLYTPTSSFPEVKHYAVIKTNWPAAPFSLVATDKEVTLKTSQLKVTVARKDGGIVFSDAAGKRLMQDGGRTMTPVVVNGEKTYHAEEFVTLWGSPEGFYGLGQHQAGVWNYRGESVDISQDNSNISIPMLLSTNGYGLFWNNPSRSRFNNRFMQALYISSEVADQIDYYFIYGPQFDKIVAAYRELTGAAPLFGKWAYGFWQCKNRYQSQQELLEVAHKYRELRIPVDNIVQDWFWWKIKGDFEFNSHYPDPKGMIDDLHGNHFHLMISVWPYFDPGSKVYQELDKLGYFIDRTKAAAFHPAGMALYDAFNPAARKFYWGLMDNVLFKIGADAWWLDTTEPETEGRETNILVTSKVGIENGARYANLFPLMTTEAVYDGQRSASDQKRVFILSRSGYAGIQRHATATWSGDINSDWETFKRQIPAGLNLMLSGIPYWTTDIGGFTDGNPDDPAYRELFVRWFEYGTFCPIFRVHGTRSNDQNELWSYGADAQEILTRYDTLRYRLMPYIYSLAWQVTRAGYTLMRPLVMDYREEVTARNIGDQFTFGPALLVSPVTDPGVDRRRVYLPNANWVNFWTGESQSGGKFVLAAAPLETLPLFVRSGSILPMGPAMEYTGQTPEDPIELRIYPGADADFTLYEDDGLTYDYEKGAYATIPIRWDDSRHTLTIGARQGNFPGVHEHRTFYVVWVGPGHGVGVNPCETVDKTVAYDGTAVTLQQ
ncbi:MAG TPA: TIM-barrel domain-containing protein [Terriglobia bacterium]|nr:TIM-barrel domain-containing protein [Terriglobia bacterium]